MFEKTVIQGHSGFGDAVVRSGGISVQSPCGAEVAILHYKLFEQCKLEVLLIKKPDKTVRALLPLLQQVDAGRRRIKISLIAVVPELDQGFEQDLRVYEDGQ